MSSDIICGWEGIRDALGLHPTATYKTVIAHMRKLRLPVTKIGKNYMIPRALMVAWITDKCGGGNVVGWGRCPKCGDRVEVDHVRIERKGEE